MKPALALTVTLLSAACCTQPATDSAPAAAAAQSEEPATAPEAASPEALTIGPDGVANLRGETPFTVAAVEKAFPGFVVIPIADPKTGVSTFEVRPEGSASASFLVEPDWTRGYVAMVRNRDPSIVGPAGEQVGIARLSELSDEKKSLCDDDEPDGDGADIICPDPVAPERFSRVYRYELPHKSVETIFDERNAAVLVELRYAPELPE